MEVYPPDDLQPNEVGSGPTVSHLEQMKAWDDIANFEKVLQAACETNETHPDVNNCSKDDVLTSDHATVNENPVCNTETKRKWDEEIADAVESNKHKLKRINNMVLSSGEVTIQLVGSNKDSCDNIPISNLLSTVVKPEPKTQSDDFPYKVSEKMPNETKNSLKFIKLESETEIKDEITDFKTEVLENESDIFMDVKNDSSLSEEKSFSKRIASRDLKNDNCFTDDLSSETKHEFYPSSKNILSYSLKDSDENNFQSDINTEGTLSTEVPAVLPHKSEDLIGCTLSEDDGEKMSPLEISDITNSQDSYEKKKDKKERIEELCEKNVKKDDKLSKKKKFERCNIRDIKLEDELDAVTLSAQKEEQERIRRLQEAQMRALQERLQQIEVEKEALTQLFSQPPADAPNLFDSSSINEAEPTNESKETTVKSENDVVLVESSDEDKKAKLQDILPPPIEENIIDISSSSSGNESDSDDSEKKDDDIMVLSDEGEVEGDGTAEDPNNSGAHTNDCFNLPDEEGRVLVNVGHPPEDPDIFLAPQIAKVIKPHQIGGIRFLYDNVVENLERYKSSSGFGCILAHSMGLGKTVQVVSFVDVFLRHTPATLVLCIVPINTIQNWKAEFDMWVPPSNSVDDAQVLGGEVRPRDYNVYTLNENFKTMAARAALIAEWRKQGGVLLMGYEMYRMLALRKMPKVPVKKSKRLKKQELCVEPETNEQIKKYM
ncbi:Helicase ARIP4, partial [Stegodyphus mimosarum]